MSILVADASVAAKWFLDEDLSDRARRVLRSGYGLHAPDFLFLEMDSILLKRVRRGDISSADAHEARLMLGRIPIARHSFIEFLDSAYGIAGLCGLSVYDSLYIALALALKTQAVTADRRLYDAVGKSPLKKHAVWVGDVK